MLFYRSQQTLKEMERDQKLAIVTGAGRGIGRALTKELTERGYYVLAVDRDLSLLEKWKGVKGVKPVKADIGTPRGQSLVKDTIYGKKLHILAHIAHATAVSPLMKMKLEDHRDIQRSNIEAAIFLTKSVMGNIEATGGVSRILLVGAPIADSYKAIPTVGSLMMTKCALKYIANVLKIELQGKAKVGYIEPGLTNTPFAQELMKAEGPMAKMVAKRINSGECYTEEESGAWVAAVLDQPDEIFECDVHKEDNPEQSYGIELTETPERKGKWKYTKEAEDSSKTVVANIEALLEDVDAPETPMKDESVGLRRCC